MCFNFNIPPLVNLSVLHVFLMVKLIRLVSFSDYLGICPSLSLCSCLWMYISSYMQVLFIVFNTVICSKGCIALSFKTDGRTLSSILQVWRCGVWT